MYTLDICGLREKKPGEKRAISPEGVALLIEKMKGHASFSIMPDYGETADFLMEEYISAGATVYGDLANFRKAVLRSNARWFVKEPQPSVHPVMHRVPGYKPFGNPGDYHFQFDHPIGLSRPVFTQMALSKGIWLSADLPANGMPQSYEGEALGNTAPLDGMSGIAGLISIDEACRRHDENGMPSKLIAVIVGYGHAGQAAAARLKEKSGDIEIRVLDVSNKALAQAKKDGLKAWHSDSLDAGDALKGMNILIGAALVRGKDAPITLTREKILEFIGHEGILVVVDISCDQRGCFDFTRDSYTTHEELFRVEGQFHIMALQNMPSFRANEASTVYSRATAIFWARSINPKTGALKLRTAKDMVVFAGGHCCHIPTAEAHGLQYVSVKEAMESSGFPYE